MLFRISSTVPMNRINTIWGVQPRPDAGMLRMVRIRLLSFTVVLGIGFLLLVSLLISAALAAFGDVLASLLPGAAFVPLWQGINFLLSLLATTLLFGMIYTILPDVQIRWRDVWVGAAITALLFGIGRYLIGVYIGQSDIGDTYGAAGAVIVLIIWVYFASQVVLLGAEFTAVYAKRYGAGLLPDAHAVALTDDTRAHQGIPRQEQKEAAAGK
jgi:membrane protein